MPPAVGGESAAFMILNRNKRGIALDLKSEGGRAALEALIARADVLVETSRHDTMPRLGLDADRLEALNPGLIVCTVSGFGRTGPYAERGGFDLIAQGMSGLMSITGEGEGRPPIKVGAPVTDITAGILGAMGVCAAFARKRLTGEGGTVDTSLLEAGIVQTYWQSAIAFATGAAPGPLGSAHPLNAPYQAFRTADGWVNVGAANQRNWERLLDVLDAPELRADERFATNAARMAHLDALTEALTPFFEKRGTAEWLAAFDRAGFPAGPVLDVAEMHADPHVRARGMVLDVDHPAAGATRAIGAPVKFDGAIRSETRPAPVLGQHTREVLAEAGLSAERIDAMIESGAAIQAQPD